MAERDSFFSVPPPRTLIATGIGAVLLSVCSAIGGAMYSSSTNWVGGIATNAELDQALSPVATDAAAAKAGVARIAKLVGEPTEVEARETFAERLRSHSTADLAIEQRVGLQVRERLGYQVKSHYGMDPKRAKSAEEKRLAALEKYEEFVMRYGPEGAADKVLQQMRIPR